MCLGLHVLKLKTKELRCSCAYIFAKSSLAQVKKRYCIPLVDELMKYIQDVSIPGNQEEAHRNLEAL